MASLSPSPKFKAFYPGTNLPLVGGKLYTYLAGTTTLQATALDAAGTSNTNPVILDSNGECNLWLNDISYKYVLKDPAESTIWTVDNIVSGAATANAAIAALYASTFSSLATTTAAVDQIITIRRHTSGTVGGGQFIGVPSTGLAPDGGTISISATAGIYWQRINYSFLLVQFWGVMGNGIADDTVAVQLAINSGAKFLYWPSGTYNIGAAGLTGVSSQTWQGAGVGLTKILLTVVPTLDFIKISSKNNFYIYGITFDGNAKLTAAAGGSYPLLLPIIYALQCSYYEIRNCEFIGFHTCGMLSNICHDYKINDNNVTRTGATGTIVNYGISCPGGVGSESYNAEVCNNTVVRCDIGVNGSYFKVNGNNISGWAFSSGIDFVVDPTCHDNEASGNTIHDSVQAPDKDAFFPCGIENWGKNTVLTNNIIYGCYGDGIENGGRDCTIDNNQCRNNGSSGLYNLYQDATYNASGTVAEGNVFNNNGQFGIREQSALLTDLKYGPAHRLSGNTSGKFNLLAASEYYDSASTTLGIIGATTAGTQTFSKNAFDWVRGGRSVTITGRIQLSALTGTGQVRITGLPFAARNTADLFGTGSIQYSGFTTTWVSIVALVNQGQTYLTLTGNAIAATGNNSVNMSDLSATSLICFTVTYLV